MANEIKSNQLPGTAMWRQVEPDFFFFWGGGGLRYASNSETDRQYRYRSVKKHDCKANIPDSEHFTSRLF